MNTHIPHLAKGGTAALLFPLLLAACSALPERPQRSQAWDLGAPPALHSTTPQGAALSLPSIHATPALEGSAIRYRLLYNADGDLQPRPYAHSRWASPVPQLLAQRLKQHLATSRPVLDANNGSLTAYSLQIELGEFAQHFTSESESSGVIQLRATLFGGQPKRLIAQRNFTASHPAPTPDAAGGVQALRAAAGDIADQLDAWLRQHDTPKAEQVK